ncbi:hypothetical protein NXC24_PC01770 (plasmid) [Rhizobium sp. NXC24]|nr:hypothetical protein NXC24_PC01770 [Rhizobium sp. NXC24]
MLRQLFPAMEAAGVSHRLRQAWRSWMNMNGVLKNGVLAPVLATGSVGGVTGFADTVVRGSIDCGK